MTGTTEIGSAMNINAAGVEKGFAALSEMSRHGLSRQPVELGEDNRAVNGQY